MNRKIGMVSSIVTAAAVLAFALSMIFGSSLMGYISSMFIAWGFVPMVCAIASGAGRGAKAAGFTAMAFASIYALLIMLVYFAQLTAVRFGNLGGEALGMLDYTKYGLLFSYDLLGYGFMALSTFFLSFTVEGKTKLGKWLRALLMIHGFFAFICVLPMLNVFNPSFSGGAWVGMLALECWCVYFLPVCALAFLHFKRQQVDAAL